MSCKTDVSHQDLDGGSGGDERVCLTINVKSFLLIILIRCGDKFKFSGGNVFRRCGVVIK